MIKAILAHGLNGEIGQNGDMPWGRSLPKDLQYFKKVTLNQEVVVGRNTFNTLPFNGKGFPSRSTLVLTRCKSYEEPLLSDNESVYFFSEEEVRLDVDFAWVVGGSQTYETFKNDIKEWHVTTVKHSFPEADTFFTPDLSDFEKVGDEIDVSSDKYEASVQVWRKKQNNI